MRITIGLALIALVAAAQPADGRPQPAALIGTFVASRIDAAPLPMTDRVTDTDGTTYLVEFDRLVLSLRPGNRFLASVRYRRTLHSRDPRGRDRATPVQSMTVNGSYAIVNGEIRFRPDPSKDTGALRMLTGRVESTSRVSMPFHYRNGTAERQRTLLLVRQDDVL